MLTHTVKLKLTAELVVFYDPKTPKKNPNIRDLLKKLRNATGYAVGSGDPQQYTANLNITSAECVTHACPLCKQALELPEAP